MIEREKESIMPLDVNSRISPDYTWDLMDRILKNLWDQDAESFSEISALKTC